MKPHLRKVWGEWVCGLLLEPLRNRIMIGCDGATPKEAFDEWNADTSAPTRLMAAKHIAFYAKHRSASGVL